MKALFVTLLILFIATPAFCAPNFDPNNKAQYYDETDTQNYIQQLEDNYHKKYTVQVSPTEFVDTAPINAWNNEVVIPSYEYIIAHPAKYTKN